MPQSTIKERVQDFLCKLCKVERNCLSLEEEARLKNLITKYLGKDAIALARKLMLSGNGLPWDPSTSDCPSKRLIDMGLARFDGGNGEKLLKALPPLFDEMVQFLVGIVKSY